MSRDYLGEGEDSPQHTEFKGDGRGRQPRGHSGFLESFQHDDGVVPLMSATVVEDAIRIASNNARSHHRDEEAGRQTPPSARL